MRPNKLPESSRLKDLFTYNEKTGELFWRSGKPARSKGSNGYLKVQVDGVSCLVHRVIWKILWDKDPEWQLDHIDGNKTNNRIENLREATEAQNKWNRSHQKNSLSKVKGVSFDKRSKLWVVQISYNKKRIREIGYKNKLIAEQRAIEIRKTLHAEFTKH